jgi:hypothetical protein
MSLNWDMGPDGKHCEHCGKGRMSHYNWWNKHIMNPINKNGYNFPMCFSYYSLTSY